VVKQGTCDLAVGSPRQQSITSKESDVGVFQSFIRNAVVSALGAKLARRSPIVGALVALLLSRALAKKTEEPKPNIPGTDEGVRGLVERFRQGGLEEVITSWIGTGPNKPVSPNQLQQALGPETVEGLARETGMPRDDLLSQLSRLLPEVVDKLSPNGNLPKEEELLPGLNEPAQRPGRRSA
jgi:uncharacterized protein YidB (DUF937 family)